MSIRPDFKEVESQLTRLRLYSEQAAKYNHEDWSRLRNKEDFDQIYDYQDERCGLFEQTYSTGRDCAVWLSYRLSEFDMIGDYPTLKSYVESFTGSWVYQVEQLKSIADRATRLSNQLGAPSAVWQMILIFEKEIQILDATAVIIEELKESNLYKRESGIKPLLNNAQQTYMNNNFTFNSPANVQVGNQNTQSITQTFNEIIEKINSSNASDDEKTEAKSKLMAFIEHPLVTSIVGGVAGGLVGLAK